MATTAPAGVQAATITSTTTFVRTRITTAFGSPDDVVVAPNGDIIFGDFGNKALDIIRNGAAPVPLSTGISEPEGIVIAKDGAYIVTDQATDNIYAVDPRTGAKTVLRHMVNSTGQEGVDGLGIDPATGDILVPDSAYGRLYRMSRDGSNLTLIASGFVRPTGAAVEPGGSIVVADEFGNAVYRLQNGKKTWLAYVYQPDDVVVGKDGSIYTNSLLGTIWRIDPVTLKKTAITSGLGLAHGVGIGPGGNIIVASATYNRLYKLTPVVK